MSCLRETGFGYIVVDGKRYDHDIVVYPDDRIEKRHKELSRNKSRVYGHTPLSGYELSYYLRHAGPIDCLVIGTGQYGALPLDDEAREIVNNLRGKGVHVEIIETPKLIEKCREILDRCRRALLIIHVTC